MYILDTNVVSELRKASDKRADPNVTLWAERITTAQTYLSVVTIIELEQGILRIERRDHAQGLLLRRWLEERIIPRFTDRTLPIDMPVARRCARLHVPNPRQDRDALIAATALVHGLVVVTRNAKDFAGTGVTLLDPWVPPAH